MSTTKRSPPSTAARDVHTAKKPKKAPLPIINDVKGLAAAERELYLTDGELDAAKTNAALTKLGFADGIAYSTVNMKDHRALGTFKTEANLDDAFFLQLLPEGAHKSDWTEEVDGKKVKIHRRSAMSLDNATLSTNLIKMKVQVYQTLTAMGRPMKMRVLDSTVPKLVTIVACMPDACKM